MTRLAVLNQLREDLIEVLEELAVIGRGKADRRRQMTTRIASLKAEATTIRTMIRYLERRYGQPA